MSTDRHKDPTRTDYMYRSHLEDTDYATKHGKYSELFPLRKDIERLRIKEYNAFTMVINGIMTEESFQKIKTELKFKMKQLDKLKSSLRFKD